MRAGTYDLQQDMTYSAVLKILTTPPTAAKVTNITIIEGRTRAQINDLLKAQGVKGSYFVATRHSPLINFAAYGAPRHTPDLEGFLFPDTYQLVEPISIPALVDRSAQDVPDGVGTGQPRLRPQQASDAV